MPLRIWMPSCAAGPLNTAACPSRILSFVTPCADASIGTKSAGSSAAAAVTISFLVMVILLLACDRQEIRVPHELGHVELLPRLACLVLVLGALPCGGRRRRLSRLPGLGVAQAERAVDQQRRADAIARRDEEQPGLLAERYALPAEESREIDHAVEIAAHVRHALEPRAGLRHRRDRRHRNHLAGLGQVD